MGSTGQHIVTKKWMLYFMAFAFFWLVIGDLISLHQKAIFGFDPFSHETPFTKSDNKHNKAKADKTAKFDKFKDKHHSDAIQKKDFRIKVVLEECDFEFINTFTVFLSESGYPLLALRGPPTV